MADLKRISAAEAQQLLADGYAYLDVRSVPEFEQGHPAGAYNVPLMHAQTGRMAPNPDFLAVVQAAFSRDARLVVGCKTGGRSVRAAELLIKAGYTALVEMRCGWAGAPDATGRVSEPGWSALGLPAAQRADAGRSYDELAARATGTRSSS